VPDVNSGKDWSELDLQDLRDGLRLRSPIAELAEFLCRDVAEVESQGRPFAGRAVPAKLTNPHGQDLVREARA
jgi:hypothetical protein